MIGWGACFSGGTRKQAPPILPAGGATFEMSGSSSKETFGSVIRKFNPNEMLSKQNGG